MGVAAAVLAAGAIGAVGTYEGAKIQAGAQTSAANLQNSQFQQTRATLAPFVQSGQNANAVYANLSGANGAGPQSTALNSMAQNPYMSAMQSTANAQTLAAAGSAGAGVGGNVLNALYGQNAGLYNSVMSQQEGLLQNEAQMGLNAAGATGQAGANAAQSQGNFLSQAGATMGSATAGVGNALANGTNNAALMYALNNRGTTSGGSGYGLSATPVASYLNSILPSWS
jgi:hypothetical protein